MNAIILADFGRKIRPLTDGCPKSMLKIANLPLLDYTFAQLKHYGLNDIAFVSAVKNEKAFSYVSAYKGLNCRFYDDAAYGGASEAIQAANRGKEDIVVAINCDSVNDIDLQGMIYTHADSGAKVTMAVVPQKSEEFKEAVLLDENNFVYAFSHRFGVYSAKTFSDAGVYVINKSTLNRFKKGLTYESMREFLSECVLNRTLKAFVHNGSYCAIEDAEGYFNANFYLKDGGFFPEVPSYEKESVASATFGGSLVSTGAVTVGGFRDCIVGKGARIASCALISDCVVMDDTLVTGKHSYAVIGPNFVENIACPMNKTEFNPFYYDNLLQTGI